MGKPTTTLLAQALNSFIRAYLFEPDVQGRGLERVKRAALKGIREQGDRITFAGWNVGPVDGSEEEEQLSLVIRFYDRSHAESPLERFAMSASGTPGFG